MVPLIIIYIARANDRLAAGGIHDWSRLRNDFGTRIFAYVF
jgi:hypothetical protein